MQNPPRLFLISEPAVPRPLPTLGLISARILRRPFLVSEDPDRLAAAVAVPLFHSGALLNQEDRCLVKRRLLRRLALFPFPGLSVSDRRERLNRDPELRLDIGDGLDRESLQVR